MNKEIKAQLDFNFSADSNLQHLIHLFAGYRSIVTCDEEERPYSLGSARDVSFQEGRNMAMKDLITRGVYLKTMEANGKEG